MSATQPADRMTPAQWVRAILDRWAKMSADDLAAHLHRAGIRGIPATCAECPVAMGLSAAAGGRVRVNETEWWIGPNELIGRAAQRGKLPPSVAYLIDRIDRGDYPELEA